MKRIFTAALAICFFLGGCGVIKDQNQAGANVPVSELDMSDNEYTGRVETSAVYFLNKTSGTLTAELRKFIINQDTNPAKAAVEQLLEGPSNSEEIVSVAPDGMHLDFIEFSRNVANVYLLYDGEAMQQNEKFVLEHAIANTITDILGATYICVFYNGVQTGFAGVPCAPNQKQTGSIDEAWLHASAKYPTLIPEDEMETDESDLSTTAPEQTTEDAQTVLEEQTEPKVSEITTVLYFVSAEGGFILPEVRDVAYSEGNYIQRLIEELKIGPHDTSIITSPFVYDLELNEEPQLLDVGDGRYRLKLDFSKLPTRFEFADDEETPLSFAAIIYTVTGFVPGIESVEISVMGTKITSINGLSGVFNGMRRSDYIGYMGSSAPLYFAYKNSDLLLEISRSMEQEKIWSVKARVLEILRGRLSKDGDNVRPVMPSGVSQEDILSVDVYEDTAYVNLSQNFKDACTGYSSKSEMLLVYSIVNTITAMDGINKVQFLIEGEQTKELAGYICLSDPFLKNYGIIKNSG